MLVAEKGLGACPDTAGFWGSRTEAAGRCSARANGVAMVQGGGEL